MGIGSVAYRYSIGKHEITNAQYIEFLNSVDPTGADPLALYSPDMSTVALGGVDYHGGSADGTKYESKPGHDNKPVSYVTWYSAVRFTNWLHNGQGNGDTENGAYTIIGGTPIPSNGESIIRNPSAKWFLPSANEWHKAAYHKNDGVTGNYWDFPTATNAEPYSDQPPGGDAPDQTNTANFDKNDFVANGYDDGYSVTASPTFVDSLNYLTDTGTYTLSTSPYGTFDQAGNVWEWTETLVETSGRGGRGGSWANNSSALLAANSFSTEPTRRQFTIGFRVATIPEPSSIVLGASTVTLMVWRRRTTR